MGLLVNTDKERLVEKGCCYGKTEKLMASRGDYSRDLWDFEWAFLSRLLLISYFLGP